MSDKESEPRRHHYVPRCWLAGFTETGEKDGKLWVTDIVRRKQWESSPGGAGFIRDFYRLSDDEVDPVMVEKRFHRSKVPLLPFSRAKARSGGGLVETSSKRSCISLQSSGLAYRPSDRWF